MSQQNLEQLEQEMKPKSNYIRFSNGEKKVLIFNGDPEHAHSQQDEKYGLRARFIVVDVTDPMRPEENKIWDVSPRWAMDIIYHLRNNEECLEIERQGAGTTTNYRMRPANKE